VFQRPSVGTAFWQEQSRRFRALREKAISLRKRPLGASYHPDGWNLEKLRAFEGLAFKHWYLDNGTPEISEEFKSVASVCSVALGWSNTDHAWVEWLDCLRREGVDFKLGSVSVGSRVYEWRPEPPDYEVTVAGMYFEPLPVRPDPDAAIIDTDIGEIDDVCDASERVCSRLADEALKMELSAAGIPPLAESFGRIPEKSDSDAAAAGLPAVTAAGQTGANVAPPPDSSKTLTLKEAATALRTSEDTLHRMRKRGEVNMFKVGKTWRVLASEVIRLRQQPKFSHR